MRTIATFHSSVFNAAESRPYFINPACFGDDVARWLIARLRETGARTDDEPGQEDFGWYFDFEVPEGTHTCVISLRPGEAGGAPDWVVWVERSRGLLGSMLGGRRRGIAPSATARLHDALSRAPEVTALRWHEQRDFDVGRDEAAPLP